MKKGIIPKLSMGVALAAAFAVGWSPAANAELSQGSDTFTFSQAANSLVMPFDLTGTHVSFQMVSFSNVSSDYTGLAVPGDPIVTHWSYWSDSCVHIRDVIICLTIGDSIVVDPTKLHGEIQSLNPPANNPTTPDFDLGDVRGSVYVTAFLANTGPSGEGCTVDDALTPIENVIVGSWVIADTTTGAAFGGNAIGMSSVIDEAANVSFDVDTLDAGGLYLQSFNPQSLGDSDIIVLTVDSLGGCGLFTGAEWGPISPFGISAASAVMSSTRTTSRSSPRTRQFCFDCTGFATIGPTTSADDCAVQIDCLLPVRDRSAGRPAPVRTASTPDERRRARPLRRCRL